MVHCEFATRELLYESVSPLSQLFKAAYCLQTTPPSGLQSRTLAVQRAIVHVAMCC